MTAIKREIEKKTHYYFNLSGVLPRLCIKVAEMKCF